MKLQMKKMTLHAAQSLLPRRRQKDNKLAGGKALIIAGHQGMWGAAVLAATAASRVGAGYVTLMTDQKRFPSVRHPDFLTVNWSARLSTLDFSAVACGPGLGKTVQATKLVRHLLKEQPTRVVLDADALNACAKIKVKKFPASWILTPHEGELARLLGISAQVIRGDRPKYAQMAAQKFGCLIVLKGFRTLVADGHELHEIQSGNSSLAKAGTGDVLTGIIVGFLSQGLEPMPAARLGAFVHGWLADEWIRLKNDHLSLMPMDLLVMLPKGLSRLRLAGSRESSSN